MKNPSYAVRPETAPTVSGFFMSGSEKAGYWFFNCSSPNRNTSAVIS